jgi:glycosyltransferase involved in cell wall biosynthesis
MKLSYLITCSNETQTLRNLLGQVDNLRDSDDEIVIVLDSDCKDNKKTRWILDNWKDTYWNHYEHPLNNNYSEHKNWGALKCSGDYIFQIDGDECPTETLLLNVKDLIQANPDIEVFWIPRINDFKGVTPQHAAQWGWRLTQSTTYNRPIVNWPDPQGRLFKNIPNRIKWVGRLHERVEGNETYVYLPFDEDLSLYHDKTIEKQIETNLRYNTVFSKEENQGFKLPK